MFKVSVLAIAIAVTSTSVVAEETPSLEAMWQLIKSQQNQIDGLKKELDQAEHKIQQTEVKVIATADAVEAIEVGDGIVGGSDAQWAEKTTLGGYGELHYNNLENQSSAVNSADDKTEIDFHRFVMFFDHEFNESVRFFSELELEHAESGEGKNGAVELEQAYLEYDYADNHGMQAGLFLVPVGIINETHEPNTFYGVERNNIEKNIIPTTWREAGINLKGYVAEGIRYDLAATSGLFIEDGEYKVRDGRQSISKAKADDLAYTGRIKYTGITGFELAVTVQYQNDLFQSESRGAVSGMSASLFEAHATYVAGVFSVRALYAQWDMNSNYEQATGKVGSDQQLGWYIEPSFKLSESLGLFTRYGEWDNQAGSNVVDSQYAQWSVGANYWLTPQVVFKADYQNQTAARSKDEFDGFNLGVGYSF